MLSADTNVLVRALVNDPGASDQCSTARNWLASCTELYVPQAVQIELVWLLQRVFALKREEVVHVLAALRDHATVTLQSPEAFDSALTNLKSGGDFADGIILFEARSANALLYTFDAKFAKRAGANLARLL